MQVRPATQLQAIVANLDDAYLVPILIAEEGQSAHLQRVVQLPMRHLDGTVLPHAFVDHLFDAEDVAVRKSSGMRKIEAQAVRGHQGAGLLDMVAEHLSERGMQHMRPRMIQRDGLPAGRLNACQQHIVQAHTATGDQGAMDRQAVHRSLRILDFQDNIGA